MAKKKPANTRKNEKPIPTVFGAALDYSHDADVMTLVNGLRRLDTSEQPVIRNAFAGMTSNTFRSLDALFDELLQILRGDAETLEISKCVDECKRRLTLLKAYLTLGWAQEAVFHSSFFYSSLAALEDLLRTSDPPKYQRSLEALARGRALRSIEAEETATQIRSQLLAIWRLHPDQKLTWVRNKLASEKMYSLGTIKRYSNGLTRTE